MDAQTELERALTLIDDLVMAIKYDNRDAWNIVEEAEQLLKKHKRIP